MHCLVVNVCTACGVAPTTSEACSCKGPLQNAFRGQGCFHILSSSLLSFQSCSTSCAPALLNDPPAEMKALCNISQRTVWHFIWHVYSKNIYSKTVLWAALEMILQSQTCKAARTTKICRKLWLFRWNHWRTALAQSWAHF